MKKFVCLLLTVVFVLSLNTFAFAEEVKIEADWVTYLGKVEVTKTVEEGETVYEMRNFGNSYHSPGIDITGILKELIKGKNSMTLNFSLDVKTNSEEDITFGMLIRMDNVHHKIKLKNDFKDIYPGSAVLAVSDGTYLARLVSGATASSDWETIEGEITFTPDDIVAGLWKNMVLCFDGMAMYEAIDTIFVKNTKIEIVDYEEGDGKPTIDVEKLNIEKPTIALDDTDTPALPEGNKLTNNAWYKVNLGNVIPVENPGEGISAFSNIGSSFASPAINIYPTIKEMLGDKESIKVWIVFDVRASLTEMDKGFGIKIRPNITNDYVNDKGLFLSKYKGSAINHTQYGIMISPYSDGKFTNKWQRIELSLTFTKEDINDELWTEWNLCFDGMTDYYAIKEIQVKDTAIYYAEDYESIYGSVVEEPETEQDTNKMPMESYMPKNSDKEYVVYKPYGFDRYNVTFADVVENPLPEGIEDLRASSNNYLTYIIIGAVAVVVLAAGAVVVIKMKNKKGEEK